MNQIQKTENKELTQRSAHEKKNIDAIKQFHLNHIEKWGGSWTHHSLVTLQRQSISRILYYDALYQKIVGVPGCILEFGVQWGATLAQLISLRGIYEPYNHTRHIYGFDSFEGFINVDEKKDGSHSDDGDYRVYGGYEKSLDELLRLHEENCPLPHIRKFSLIKGNASITSKNWVNENRHAIVAMVIFDMDIYQPTKDALEAIKPRLVKGSVLVFDELNCALFPGETEALDEVLTLNNLKLHHHPHQPNAAWAIWGE
jgi:hypothetical protein